MRRPAWLTSLSLLFIVLLSSVSSECFAEGHAVGNGQSPEVTRGRGQPKPSGALDGTSIITSTTPNTLLHEWSKARDKQREMQGKLDDIRTALPYAKKRKKDFYALLVTGSVSQQDFYEAEHTLAKLELQEALGQKTVEAAQMEVALARLRVSPGKDCMVCDEAQILVQLAKRRLDSGAIALRIAQLDQVFLQRKYDGVLELSSYPAGSLEQLREQLELAKGESESREEEINALSLELRAITKHHADLVAASDPNTGDSPAGVGKPYAGTVPPGIAKGGVNGNQRKE